MKPAVFISIGILVVIAAVALTLGIYQWQENQKLQAVNAALTVQVQQLTQEREQLRAANVALAEERDFYRAALTRTQILNQQAQAQAQAASQQQQRDDGGLSGLFRVIGTILPMFFGLP